MGFRMRLKDKKTAITVCLKAMKQAVPGNRTLAKGPHDVLAVEIGETPPD